MHTYTAFDGFKKLISSDLERTLLTVKKRVKAKPDASILIFSDLTGKQMDFDLSGTEADVVERHKIYTAKITPPSAGVGRPKLGVVAREVSLLPQQWEWLNLQPAGASSAIRILIDEKIKLDSTEKLKVKRSQEVTYRFLSAIAGDLPNYEEAIRYLYRSDQKKFAELVSDWKKDLVDHTFFLAADAFRK